MRILRRPEPGFLDGHLNLPAAGGAGRINHLAAVVNRHFHRAHAEQRGRDCLDGDRAGVHVGGDFQVGNVGGIDRLEPYGLPDAAGWRVPDAVRLANLFAAGLGVGIGWVPGGDDQFVLGGRVDRVGDIEAEGIIAAAVPAHFAAVDEHYCLVVHRAEMEQDSLALPLGGQFERAPIPDSLVLADRAHDAGQRGLDRERHQDAILEGGPRSLFAGDCEVPEAVEVQPVLARHLRPRVFGEGILGRDFPGPARFQRPICRLP